MTALLFLCASEAHPLYLLTSYVDGIGGDSGDQPGQVPQGATRAGGGRGQSGLGRELHVQDASQEQNLSVGHQNNQHQRRQLHLLPFASLSITRKTALDRG